MSEIITEQKYPIQRRWIFIFTIRIVLLAIFVFILSMIQSYFEDPHPEMSFWDWIAKNPETSIYFWLFSFIVLAVAITEALRRHNFHYAIDDAYLTLGQGVISKQQRHIPYGKIQNIYVSQGLLDRIFGLTLVVIENVSQESAKQNAGVGFFGNRITIPGLTKESAEIVKNAVLQKMKESPLGDGNSGL